MSQRIEILRALIREELSRREVVTRRSERLRHMIRFADVFESLGSEERNRLRMVAASDPRVTVEDVNLVPEVKDEEEESDEDEDLNEIPPSI